MKDRFLNKPNLLKLMENEELTTEELTFAAHDKIDALIDILIEKNIITEEELVASLKKIYKEFEKANE